MQKTAELSIEDAAVGVIDIVDSGMWLRHHGDVRFSSDLNHLKDAIWRVVALEGGRVLADTGDGCIFDHRDVDGAVAICRAVRRARRTVADAAHFELRHAVHFGPVVHSRYGVSGTGVYGAVELADAADAGVVSLSPAAAARHASEAPVVGARIVDLRRSGAVPVVELALDAPPLDAASVPVLQLVEAGPEPVRVGTAV